MSRARRILYRKKLDTMLSRAPDEQLFTMIWAVRALQSGAPQHAALVLSFPPTAITSDMTSRYFVRQWTIETLLNEALIVPKEPIIEGRRNSVLKTWEFATTAALHNALNELEDAEDTFSLPRMGIEREMHRLGQRQFEWQRGFLSLINLYRSAYLYGGPITRAFLESKLGFTLDQFMMGCFALRAVWIERPIVPMGIKLTLVGIDDDTAALIVKHLTLPHLEARRNAKVLRSVPGNVAYQPSLFRRHPCISFGSAQDRIYAPLPELLMARCTSGLFYDVVGSQGNIRNEISRRFEQYCRDILAGMLTELVVKPEFKYPFKGNVADTPDLFLCRGNVVEVVVECKARRMSYAARFGEDPVAEASDGYEEIAKGVFQIWKYTSHVRRDLIDELVAQDLCGVVLTLDTWATMGGPLLKSVMSRAIQIAAERDPEITERDRIPVAFCSIEDLEQTLSQSTDRSLLEAIRVLAREDRRGWHLWSVHKELVPELPPERAIPFDARLAEILPWWDALEARRRAVKH